MGSYQVLRSAYQKLLADSEENVVFTRENIEGGENSGTEGSDDDAYDAHLELQNSDG